MIRIYFDCKLDPIRGYCIAMVDQYGHMFKGVVSDKLNFDTTDECEVGVPNIDIGGPVMKIRDEMHEWFKQIMTFDYEQTGAEYKICFFGYKTTSEWLKFCQIAFDGNTEPAITYPVPIDLVSVFWAAGYDPDTDIREFSEVMWDENEPSAAMWHARMIEACFAKLKSIVPLEE